MLCLGFEPGAPEWLAQMDPLINDCRPVINLCQQFTHVFLLG